MHLAHGGGAEKEMWVNLTNGCDILISTPHCLARLLECPLITNFERLCCLVIDEADIITHDPFISEVCNFFCRMWKYVSGFYGNENIF